MVGGRHVTQGIIRCASTVTQQALPFESIPGPTSLPCFGNQLTVRYGKYGTARYLDQLHDWHRDYGDIVREEKGWGRGSVIHLYNPEDVRTVFSNDGKQPLIVPLQETTQFYRKIRSLSLGLGNMNGPEWYRLRSAVQQAMMQPRAVQKYLPLVEQVANDMVTFITHTSDKQGIVCDMREAAARWNLESSGNLVFEKRLGCLRSGGERETWATQMVQDNMEIFRLSGELRFRLPLFKYINTPKWKQLVHTEDRFYLEVQNLIDEAIGRLSGGDCESKSLMFVSYLLAQKDISREDVAIIMFSLFSDGLSTTAPTLLYLLYCIAQHPDIQQRLVQESSMHAPLNKDLTAESVNKLTLMKACLKEAMRLYPVGTEVTRITQQHLVLSGYNIPAGTPVDVNMSVCQQSSEHFVDPLKFMPDRWLRESQTHYVGSKINPFILLPFGHGARMCVGRRFAEQDLVVLVTRLLQNVHIKCEGTMHQELATLLVPAGNYQFSFHPK